MVALLPAEGRRLPVVPPAIPLIAVAVLGLPLLVSGLAEASSPTRTESLRLAGAIGAFASYLGLVLAVGVAAYAFLLHPPALDRAAVRTALTGGWALGTTGAILAALVG